ncbi:leukocidin family pore-forming toxin [Staphylococcus aureus]
MSYTQQNYVSEVEQQNSKSVLWGVKANSFRHWNQVKNQHLIAIYFVGLRTFIVKILEIISFQTVSYHLQSGFNPDLSPQYLMKKVQAIQANLKILTEETLDVTDAIKD